MRDKARTVSNDVLNAQAAAVELAALDAATASTGGLNKDGVVAVLGGEHTFGTFEYRPESKQAVQVFDIAETIEFEREVVQRFVESTDAVRVLFVGTSAGRETGHWCAVLANKKQARSEYLVLDSFNKCSAAQKQALGLLVACLEGQRSLLGMVWYVILW